MKMTKEQIENIRGDIDDKMMDWLSEDDKYFKSPTGQLESIQNPPARFVNDIVAYIESKLQAVIMEDRQKIHKDIEANNHITAEEYKEHYLKSNKLKNKDETYVNRENN